MMYHYFDELPKNSEISPGRAAVLSERKTALRCLEIIDQIEDDFWAHDRPGTFNGDASDLVNKIRTGIKKEYKL